MENTIWRDILIAGITAILSLGLNWLTISVELRKVKKEKINDSRLPLYSKCYALLERNLADLHIVFQEEYIDSLRKLKPKMKMIASNEVLQVFKVYYVWAMKTYKDYLDYCKQNDPTDNVHIETAPDGSEYLVPEFNEHDLKYYEMQISRYIADSNITLKSIKTMTQNILNAMRFDLGNDDFDDDFLN